MNQPPLGALQFPWIFSTHSISTTQVETCEFSLTPSSLHQTPPNYLLIAYNHALVQDFFFKFFFRILIKCFSTSYHLCPVPFFNIATSVMYFTHI